MWQSPGISATIQVAWARILLTYLHSGTYTVCMYEVDATTGLDICHVCQNITVGTTPVCSFTFNQNSGLFSTFDFIGSIADPANIASWDFGDGSVGTGLSISHTYTTPGTYVICMFEVDTTPLTTVCQSCTTIIVGPQNCSANFTVVPFGLDAYFIDYSNGYSSATTYTWDFGDGSPLSTLRFPTHTYSTPGTYNACLYLNTGFCADTLCQTLTVDTTIISPMFCQAYYVFTQLSPYQLAVVNLSSGTNLSFLWDFGDGSSSTAAYPIHTYANHGSYTLCLTVSDQAGCTNTYCDTLTVDSTGHIIYRSMNVGFTINVMAPNQLNSVKDLSSTLAAHLYPNPANDQLHIEAVQSFGSELTYSIQSITGSRLLSGSISGKNVEITVSTLPQGVYILELKNEKNEVSFARFVKQ
ncbi:MAG: PKD domain-containing protein [Bacteroidetes bacterium]|nr:PKD domain-containing protein [Bacteroidota bacterium]